MDTSTHTLVIILSVTLALFLTLSIVIALQTIKLLRAIARIARKAETVIDTAEHVGQVFQNVSGPLGVIRMVKNIVEVVTRNNGVNNNEKKH